MTMYVVTYGDPAGTGPSRTATLEVDHFEVHAERNYLTAHDETGTILGAWYSWFSFTPVDALGDAPSTG